MLDVALRRPDGTRTVDPALLRARTQPALPVHDALSPLLPDGLRRGSTVGVGGSLSLLFALLGAASGAGAWCALVGLPRVSAEALAEYGLDLSRVAIVPMPDSRVASWTTAVGALLDSVEIVAARPPPQLAPGDVRRLAARARTREAVLMPYLAGAASWPGLDVRMRADRADRVSSGGWVGIGDSSDGRLRARRLVVSAEGRGGAARPRRAALWLPADGGGLRPSELSSPSGTASTAREVIELAG